MSMRGASLVSVLAAARRRQAVSFQPALSLRRARFSNRACHARPTGENGLDGKVVVQPVIVRPALALRPGTFLETARHSGQVPRVRAQIAAVDPVLVTGGTIALAEFAPADRLVGAFVASEARAGHRYAETVADADVEV